MASDNLAAEVASVARAGWAREAAQADQDTLTARLAGVDAATARELGWTEATDEPPLNAQRITWAEVMPGDKVADVSGTFWEVARIDPPRHGMRRVRYVGSGHDWHYWTGETRTVIKCAG